MSRETDSSSSGPQGRGGAAYPSGTPPYGSRQYPSLHPTQDAPDGAGRPGADDAVAKSEPKTETTLTTRIRINIPGSRPIPPVVMRKPMSEAEAAASAPAVAETEPERTAAMPVIGAPRSPEAPPAGEPQPEEKADGNDWFAPRRPSGTNGAGIPSPAAGDPAYPAPDAAAPTAAAPAAPGRPHFSDAPQPHGAPGDPTAPSGAPDPYAAGPGPAAPTGPTAGPAHGSMPLRPRPDAAAPRPGAAVPSGVGAVGLGASGGPGTPGLAPGGPGGAVPAGPGGNVPSGVGAVGLGASGGPGTPGLDGGPGRSQRPAAPRMSDDTAVLTPQKPAPGSPAAPGPGGHVSGDTLTSGAPVAPGERRAPGGPGRQSAGTPAAPDFPVGPSVAGPPPPAPRPPVKKKGRSKLVLLGVAGVFLFGVAYGAGLLLNHSEVPKATTVLGVDIGGGTKEQAVVKLEAALGKHAAKPLRLSVGDEKEQLAPDKAGLVLDGQATVRKAAGSDYNPVSVIGSLFGGERIVEPEIVVDEEKLSVALTDLAGEAGSTVEGTITFAPGKVTAVPGKAGQTLDVQRSMLSVKDAFRAQVETGRTNTVRLPVAQREPAVGQAEIDRAMKEFAEPAMSGLITIRAGGRSIDFGPAISLPKILSMKPVDGKLVEVYDKKAITELLGGTFQGVMITKGDGKQHQLSADDVAQAMGPALRGKSLQERTVDIPLNPS